MNTNETQSTETQETQSTETQETQTSSVTQVAQETQTSTGTQVAQETTQTTPPKKVKITEAVLRELSCLEEGESLTISELEARITGVKRATLQVSLSQMKKANRVELVKTGKRQPGYRLPTK